MPIFRLGLLNSNRCVILREYLSGAKYANEPYATAARFWFKVCTQMDVLEATSKICIAKLGSKVNVVERMDASNLYMKIVKLLPPEMRRDGYT